MAAPAPSGANFDAARPSVGISQTAFIFGAIGFSFVIFITMRGDLPKWLGLLGLAGVKGGAGAPKPLPAVSPTSPAATGTMTAGNQSGNQQQQFASQFTGPQGPLQQGPGTSMLDGGDAGGSGLGGGGFGDAGFAAA